MSGEQFTFTLRGFWKRAREEYLYVTTRPWSLADVGAFWDTVEDYDVVNEKLYTYYRRFTNSYELALPYLPDQKLKMLDIQARSGKGSQFWHEKGRIRQSICVDFSDYLASLAERRLDNSGLDFKAVKVLDLPLPFSNETFDLVCSYETIEHVYDYGAFFSELVRVLKDDGLLILTCPNRAWEWVHWVTAVININHSEGPHRFLKRRELLRCFSENHMDLLAENSTILLPFKHTLSIRLDLWLENHLPLSMKNSLALRRTFVMRKVQA